MTRFSQQVEAALRNDLFSRKDPAEARRGFDQLGVQPTGAFANFFATFTGGYRSESTGYLLLDPVEGDPTIETQTLEARHAFGLPHRYLVIADLEANAVLIYDCESDGVFEVDFEGGDEALVAGELEPTWGTFTAFLDEFFSK